MEYKGTIPRDFIDTLLARADVVEVINQRVPLKKAGATYKACCPFHQEKTPSFNVNPQKQFYHCFGCGASGDALKFLMEYESLSFVEAVESLASQMGMEVPRQKLTQKVRQQQQKSRDFYEVMQIVARFYRHQLRDHPASKQAKEYLLQRGLTADIAKQFMIGFAPPGWDSIAPGLVADAQLKRQLIELGMLVKKDDGNTYDRFRHRIMFPIRDGRGRVVAFGGRVLSPEDQPKYLNSPETPIFHKSYALYGLYEMRQSREKFDNIIVVEGYMDVVALAQFGVRNAVATLGTATTPEHLQMLFRQVNEVVFCFDGDRAGLAAAWKAMELAMPMMENTRSVKFLFLPDGEDPDSMVRKEGAEKFAARASKSLTLSQFWLQGLQNRLSVPITSREGRQQLVALAQPYIQTTQGLYQYLLVEAVAETVDLPTWRLERQMGVRSGFAQFKPGGAGRGQQEQAAVNQVMSLPKQLVRVLLVRPAWAAVLTELFAVPLRSSSRRDDRLLVGVLHQLTQSFDVQSAVQWMNQAGFGKEYDFIKSRLIPEDEQSLRNLMEEAASKYYEELEKLKILQQPLSRDALVSVQNYFANKHN